MQRLILFLGYPVYSIAVVLFALLLYAGIGSLITSRFRSDPIRTLPWVLGAILLLGLAYAYGLPPMIHRLLGLEMPAKIALAVIALAPIGLVLGMAYPLGISLLTGWSEKLVPWAWSMNGAFSVVASASAPYLASRVGFTDAWLSALAAYALGLGCVLVSAHLPSRPPGIELD